MASSISEGQAELINSLAPDDIPHKLRCAICSKLAVNAFRLPCCEQAICETCQSNLPQSCPVCEHSPLSAEDCNPNKSLRTTIRVFLRTAEKKREAARPKESKDSPPATVVDAPKSSLPEENPVKTTEKQDDGGQEPADAAVINTKTEPAGVLIGESKQDEITNDVEEARQEEAPADAAGNATDEIHGEQRGSAEPAETREQGPTIEGDASEQMNNNEEQFNPDMANGGASNMMFPGSVDFNQMQMMMAMQNGMAPNSFGGFPMMGMPGMGMDPMQMQNMFMNGGFPGMGMNGMGGFGGGFGQGSNDNWNGSQSWNFDQNNYNQNGPNIGTGDFGHFNSGFQTGYNQGNYGHFNDYRRGGFGRGRGRGRGYYGGYGRGGVGGGIGVGVGGGGYQQGGMNSYQDPTQFSQYGQGQNSSDPPQFQAQGDGSQDMLTGAVVQSDDKQGNFNRAEGETDQAEGSGADGTSKTPADTATREIPLGNEPSTGGDMLQMTTASPFEGPSMAGGGMNNRNGVAAIRSVLSVPEAPINAPKGPKAMRQGFPNTSLLNLRARGFQVEDCGLPVHKVASLAHSNSATQPGSESSTPDVEKDKDRDSLVDHGKENFRDDVVRRDRSEAVGSQDRERDRERDREHGRDRNKDRDRDREKSEQSRSGSRTSSRSRSKSRSRSRSRDHEHRSSHRRRHQRSDTAENDEKDEAHRRKRHKSRRQNYYEDEEPSRSSKDSARPAERSRSASPEDEKRSSGHRSRKDKDYERRSGRDKDKYRDGGDERQRSSYRSHRDRDRDYEHSSRRHDKDRERDKDKKDRKERHRERDRDRDRDRERDRDRDRDHAGHTSSNTSSKNRTADSTPAPGSRKSLLEPPPTGPRSSLDTKPSPRASEKPDHQADRRPQKDAHTLEREARNRERLLKEAQRMAGLSGLAGSKRGRDNDDDAAGVNNGRKGRRGSRRNEINGDDEEERMRRLEAEREGGRWG